MAFQYEIFEGDLYEAEKRLRRIFSKPDFSSRKETIRGLCLKLCSDHYDYTNISIAFLIQPFEIDKVKLSDNYMKLTDGKLTSDENLVKAKDRKKFILESIRSGEERGERGKRHPFSCASLLLLTQEHRAIPKFVNCTGDWVSYADAIYENGGLVLDFNYLRTGSGIAKSIKEKMQIRKTKYNGENFRSFCYTVKSLELESLGWQH